MKMTITPSGTDSGYGEALSVNPRINQTRPSGKLWLADGSSPVPNCRPAELLLTLWAAYEFGPTVPLDVDLTSAGVSFGLHTESEVDKLAEWFEFYSLRLMKDHSTAFIPYAPAGLLTPNEVVRRGRMSKMQEIAGYLQGELGEISLEHVSVLDGAQYFQTTFAETEGLLPQRTSLGKFVCPTCSYQQKKPVYHALRWMDRKLTVTSGDSVALAKCPGAKAFLQRILQEDCLISNYIQTTGFCPSGKLFYLFTRKGQTQADGLCMRDYSTPRGTVRQTVQEWDPNIWISTRFYVIDEQGSDIPLEQFMGLVQDDPRFFARVIRGNSVLSSGQVVTLIHDIGCP